MSLNFSLVIGSDETLFSYNNEIPNATTVSHPNLIPK